MKKRIILTTMLTGIIFVLGTWVLFRQNMTDVPVQIGTPLVFSEQGCYMTGLCLHQLHVWILVIDLVIFAIPCYFVAWAFTRKRKIIGSTTKGETK